VRRDRSPDGEPQSLPETEYSTTARLPVETIWDFVREMDNWAPFLTGYQRHRKESEDDSVWVLKGDVGVLTRTLELRVRVTEWAGPSRVAFDLVGLNEPMKGSGEFRMEPYEEVTDAPGEAGEPRRGAVARLLEPLFRFLFRLFRGGRERTASAPAGAGPGLARLRFRLRIDPGGPMAQMVSAMMAPAMRPAAERLAEEIVAHLEARHGLR
jgi:carbon monoxide dehydrogenase subunit G